MALNPDDMQALGLFGQQQANPYGYGSVDDLMAVQPLAFNPGPAPRLPEPSAQPAFGQPSGDKIAGNDQVLDHLATVMKASATGTAPSAPKGLVKAGETVKTMDDGLTPEQRATGVAVRGQAGLDTAGVVADRKEIQAQQFEAHAAKLRAEAAVEDEQRQKQEQENEARASRIREHQDFLAEQRDEPVNPNRYFENMSLFGKAAAILSAFSYGYLNPRNQGTAPIITQLQQLASEDTRAQIANNQEGRARRGDLIALYERRYGDNALVAKKLEADKLQTFAKKALADAEESKSAEAKAAAQDLAKNIQIQAEVKNREVEEAYAAKPPSERTTTYKPPGGAGDAGAKYLKQQKEVAELDKLWETQGVPKEERYARLQKLGMPAPTGKTAAEQTNKEQADKESAAKLALDTDEKKDLRTRLDGLANVAHGFDEIDKIGEIKRDAKGNVTEAGPLIRGGAGPRQFIDAATGSLPFGIGKGLKEGLETSDPEDLKALRRSVEKITTGMVHAESGAGVNETELTTAGKRLPLSTAEGFKQGSAELWRSHQQTYQNLKGQYAKRGIDIDAELRSRGIDPARFKAGG